MGARGRGRGSIKSSYANLGRGFPSERRGRGASAAVVVAARLRGVECALGSGLGGELAPRRRGF